MWTVTPDCRLGWQCSTLGDVPPNIEGRVERQLTSCHTTGNNAVGSASVAHYLPFVLQAWGGPKPLGQASLDQSLSQIPIALNRATQNPRAAYSHRPLMGRGTSTRAYFLMASNSAAFIAAANASAWPPMSLPAFVTASTPEPEEGNRATTANHAPSDPSW